MVDRMSKMVGKKVSLLGQQCFEKTSSSQIVAQIYNLSNSWPWLCFFCTAARTFCWSRSHDSILYKSRLVLFNTQSTVYVTWEWTLGRDSSVWWVYGTTVQTVCSELTCQTSFCLQTVKLMVTALALFHVQISLFLRVRDKPSLWGECHGGCGRQGQSGWFCLCHQKVINTSQVQLAFMK